MIYNISLIISLCGFDNLLKLPDKLYTCSYYPIDTYVAISWKISLEVVLVYFIYRF